jgi:hypothetical protein
MIAGGPIQCLDCGHILSEYALVQLERAERAEARVEELEEENERLKNQSMWGDYE